VTLKGAVVCVNPSCPRRVATRSTTINRDHNGAFNIVLIGFSSLMSVDGLPLKPFRRSYNSIKYDTPDFAGASWATTEIPKTR
jgi:hypothetical protein